MKYSFIGWNLLEFLKGRKKTVVTLVGGWLGYLFTDGVTGMVVAGGLVEMAFAIGDYWVKSNNKKF